MDIKKLFVWTTIIVGCIGLILFLLNVMNDRVGTCANETHEYNKDSGVCFYQNSTCPMGMESYPLTEDEGFNCVYPAGKYFENQTFIYMLIAIGVGWLAIFIIFIISVAKKSQTQIDIGSFKKEDFVEANRAKKLWALSFSRDNGIPFNGTEYQESAFHFSGGQRVFQKGQEWFVKFQCEVTEGTNPGLYTQAISLSRGEKWILGGMQNWEECHFKAFKLDRTMPLHTPQDLHERMMEQMWEINPEKANEMQNKKIEEGMRKQATSQVAPDTIDEQPKLPPPARPRATYRRPWYRR